MIRPPASREYDAAGTSGHKVKLYQYTYSSRAGHGSRLRPAMFACPTWLVRSVRNTVILSAIIGLFVLFNTLVFLAVSDFESTVDKRKFTLRLTRQYAEESGFCDRVDLAGNTSAYNATVLRLCRKLRQDEANFYRRQSRKVNRFRHQFLLDGREICKEDTEVMVLIHSLHTYEDRRQAIRDTWGKAVQTQQWPGNRAVNLKASVAFVVGYHRNDSWNIKVYKEAKKYNDLIMGDFIDDYRNMTLKSLLGLKWVLTFCPKVKYLIKSDDDMIINFPHLFDTLNGANMTRAIMGPINIGSKVQRRGKWTITKQEFPFHYYPPYESGSCYIFSGDIIKSLYETAEYVPWIFIDDVYITGIVGKIVRVRHLRRDGFAYWSSPKPKVCDLVDSKIITGTKMIPQYLRTLWKNLSQNPVCPVPTTMSTP